MTVMATHSRCVCVAALLLLACVPVRTAPPLAPIARDAETGGATETTEESPEPTGANIGFQPAAPGGRSQGPTDAAAGSTDAEADSQSDDSGQRQPGDSGQTADRGDGGGPVYGGTPCESDDDCRGPNNRWLWSCLEGFCNECADSSQCQENPEALGPTCNLGFCVCNGDNDCVGHRHGDQCDPQWRVCGCAPEHTVCPLGSQCLEQSHPYLTLGRPSPPMQCL